MAVTASKKKIKAKVESQMSQTVVSNAKKKINSWKLTKVEVMGKIFAETDTTITVVGKKQDAINALSQFGVVTSSRDLLKEQEVICGYRTVDMFCVQRMKERTYWFAERI